MNPLDRFMCWCQKVLPLVYDDSLSYYEVLCKLIQKINNMAAFIKDKFNSIDDEISQEIEEQTKAYLPFLIGNYKNFGYNNLLSRIRGFNTDETFVITCIGDSITYGVSGTGGVVSDNLKYPYVLNQFLHNFFDFGKDTTAEDYFPAFTVYSHAESGVTSSWALENIDLIFSENPKAIIWEFGANDVRLNIPEATLVGNLLMFADECKKRNVDLYVLNGLPVYANSNVQAGGARYQLNDCLKAACNSAGLRMIDVESMFEALYRVNRYSWESLQPDGVHPNNYSYMAYKVAMDLFGRFYESNKAGMQFYQFVGSYKKRFGNGLITSTVPTRFSNCYRLTNDSTFRFYTGGLQQYQTGIVCVCNKYSGTINISMSGTQYKFDTYENVSLADSIEKIFWFPENLGLYHSFTLISVTDPNGVTQGTQPYAYLSACVVRPTPENNTFPYIHGTT